MHTITNSERSTATCPHRWLLQYGLGMRTRKRVRALDLGSFFHEGLDAYYGQPCPAGTQVELRDRLADALVAVDRAFTKETASSQGATDSIDPGEYLSPDQIEEMREHAETAKILLGMYHAQWSVDDFVLLHNEQSLSANVRTFAGNRSTRTKFGGKVDKVVELNGRVFIVEHKTTKTPLVDWYEKNRRSPQARTYAWLLWEAGIHVHGVIWDLVQSVPPKRWDALPVLKDGKRLAKTAGLPWTTADEFEIAVRQVGLTGLGRDGTMDDADWYSETHERLKARDKSGFWLRREVELFSDEEIDRIGEELYRDATKLRRWREATDETRTKILAAPDAKRPEMVEAALKDIGTDFPRAASVCWQYNRLCPYASICHSWSRYDVLDFRFTSSVGGHDELDLERPPTE